MKWFSFGRSSSSGAPLFLFNTLGKAKQEFTPPTHGREVRMYNCGPTVYDVQHIGNLSAFVFADILRRTLEYNGLGVKQVINITDVGHLTSDADEGEDKMSKALKREKLPLTLENMRAIAEKYTVVFLEDLQKLNIDTAKIEFPRASDHIAGQIAIVKTLEEKSYAYKAEDGMYFDTSRFPAYGVLGGVNKDEDSQARIETKATKRNPTDFALWKFDENIGWDSPWGKGFPGWHIECSAMINATLGKQIDIHTGGIEHISVHHNNEIAQSEAATGKRPLSRFWLHRAHIQLEGGKMAKSEGNVVYLSDIIEKGFHPLAFRYLLLTAHYRTSANFTWDALEAAQTSFLKLRRFVDSEGSGGTVSPLWRGKIQEHLSDDLDTPGALAAVWEMMKDKKTSPEDARATVLDADRVLGFGLGVEDAKARGMYEKIFGVPVGLSELPENVRKLVEDREAAREEKNWDRADTLRNELQASGYAVEDTSSGPRISKK